MARPTLFLIDGSSQMYRAYHAFRGRGLSNQEGQTHARGLRVRDDAAQADRRSQPAYIAASFDLAGPTFRDEIAADYKANRVAMPDDLAEQINWVHQACEALGVPILTAKGYEADDVIGTVAHAGRRGRLRRGDRVDRQGLLPARARRAFASTTRARTARGSTSRGVVEKFGVKPSQVVDVLALVGDTSDNVAGVPGIGKKGAIDLVTQFGSLDALLERAAELKPKQREALTTHREDALRSRELVTIRTDVPLEVDFESLRYRGASPRALLRAVLTAGVPNARQRLRADGRHASRRTTRSSRRSRSSTRSSPSCGRPASSRCA